MTVSWRTVVVFGILLHLVNGGVFNGLETKLKSGDVSGTIKVGTDYLSGKGITSPIVCGDNIQISSKEQSELTSLLHTLQSYIHSNAKQSKIITYISGDMISQMNQIFSDNSVRRKVRNAYRLFPSTKQGITFDQFNQTLKKLKTTFMDNEVHLLYNFIDADCNGYISYNEFKKVFKFVDKKLSTWTNPELFSEIQARKANILVDFVTLDVKGTGMISMKDFAAVCQQQQFKHLTNKDIHEMSKILVDKDGMIDYNQFLGCFEIDFNSNM